ncbi:hypothetical protein EXS71_02740 [Candidatus Uhrbacteria bacterium]|nr:hypothetical protein [Candidatus Uhrbacteria bacterium]
MQWGYAVVLAVGAALAALLAFFAYIAVVVIIGTAVGPGGEFMEQLFGIVTRIVLVSFHVVTGANYDQIMERLDFPLKEWGESIRNSHVSVLIGLGIWWSFTLVVTYLPADTAFAALEFGMFVITYARLKKGDDETIEKIKAEIITTLTWYGVVWSIGMVFKISFEGYEASRRAAGRGIIGWWLGVLNGSSRLTFSVWGWAIPVLLIAAYLAWKVYSRIDAKQVWTRRFLLGSVIGLVGIVLFSAYFHLSEKPADAISLHGVSRTELDPPQVSYQSNGPDSYVRIQWMTEPRAIGYRIERSHLGDTQFQLVQGADFINQGLTVWEDHESLPSGEYYYRLIGLYSGGHEAPSKGVQLIIGSPPLLVSDGGVKPPATPDGGCVHALTKEFAELDRLLNPDGGCP